MNFKPNKHELKNFEKLQAEKENFEKLLAEKENEKLTSRSIEINLCLKISRCCQQKKKNEKLI